MSGLISDMTCSCRPKIDLRAMMACAIALDIFPVPPGAASTRGALGLSIPAKVPGKAWCGRLCCAVVGLTAAVFVKYALNLSVLCKERELRGVRGVRGVRRVCGA